MTREAKPLSWQVRAELFGQLAAMEKAGLSALQAFGLLKISGVAQERIKNTRRYLTRGMPLDKAGRQSGLFTELEASLIGAAIDAGSPAASYRRLALFYTTRSQQARTVKSRMALPACMLAFSLFSQELPALFGGSITLATYLWHAVRLIIVLALLGLAIYKLGHLQQGEDSPLRDALNNVLVRIPLFGPMLIRRNVRNFFESLALLVEAGMPILDALPRAIDTVQLSDVREAFAMVGPSIEHGATLSSTLENISLLDKGPAMALIRTGEGSGSLPEMLFRFVDMESDAINHFDKQVADWLPRIVYALIAAWITYSIIKGFGIATKLPDELR